MSIWALSGPKENTVSEYPLIVQMHIIPLRWRMLKIELWSKDSETDTAIEQEIQIQIQAGWRMDLEQPWEEIPGDSSGWEAGHESIMSSQPRKPNWVLNCIKSSRPRKGILPLLSVPMSSHLQCCIQLRGPQLRKDMDLLEQLQRRPPRCSKGWSTFDVETGWEMWLFSLEKKILWEDLRAPSSTSRGSKRAGEGYFTRDWSSLWEWL